MTIVLMTSVIKKGVNTIKRCTSYNRCCELLLEKKLLEKNYVQNRFKKDDDIIGIPSMQV